VMTGSALDQSELERLPTARDIWEAARLSPGVLVDRINIAGNDSTEPSALSGRGYAMTQQAWSIDGVTITDSVPPGIAASFFDFDSFEQIQVTSGGSDAGTATGGSINLVTRRGTNRWRGSARAIGATEGLQAGLDFDAAGLAAAGPWNLGNAQRSFGQANRIDVSSDVGAEAGGPLKSDRLWFWGGLSRQDIDVYTIGEFRELSTFTTVSLKLDGRIGSAGAWQGLFMRNRRDKEGRNVGPLRTPETAWDFPVTSGIAKAEGSGVLRGFYVTGAASYVREDLAAEAAGGRGVNAVIDPTGVWRGSFLNGTERRPQVAGKIDARTFVPMGSLSSELRLGIDHRFAWTEASANWPGTGGVIGFGTAIHSIGVPLAMATVATNNADERTITAFYAQDTIASGDWTANVGVRVDLQSGANRASTLPRNDLLPTLLPGLVFNGADAGFSWNTITPKLGLTYAAGASRRTILKASYRQFPDELSLTDIQHLNPTRYQPSGIIGVAQAATFVWLDNGDFRFSPQEIGPIVALSGVDPTRPNFFPNRVDADFHSPLTDEFIAGLDREFARGVIVSADMTWHRTTDPRQHERLVFDDAAGARSGTGRVHTAADYVVAARLTGTLPDGSAYNVPVYRLKPGVTSLGGALLTNGDRGQRSVGVTAAVRRRFDGAWMARGWVAINKWTWDVPNGAAIDPTPTVAGEFDDGGVVVQDTSALGGVKTSAFLNSQWSFNASGLYRIAASAPWTVDVAFDLYGRQGYPIPYFRTVPAAQTGDGIDRKVRVTPRVADFRNDNVINLNARIEKSFRLGGSSLSIGLDVFNLLNASTPLQRQHELHLPVGDHVIEIISPRVLRIGARLRM
ncbi:MAG TPA: TonB-dependent receptor plug domain-containing protein, partial [Vicinamibacterales bacterium]|nr:TonB-dependent receptor plug domain-containing protein [Vicinamibacterales bacterium]